MPENNFIKIKLIIPTAIPFAMEYVKGMITTVKNAGIAFVTSEKSTCCICFIIKTPRYIIAGAVAAAGTSPIIGARINDAKNNIPVITDASPVLPPTATPAADSAYVVHVELPTNAAPALEIAWCQRD